MLVFDNSLVLNSNALTKTGPGTMEINNVLTTGGGNSVQAGTISSSGQVGGDVVNDGSTISPGTSSIQVAQAQVPEPASEVLGLLSCTLLVPLQRLPFD